jgi:shikimate kinase
VLTEQAEARYPAYSQSDITVETGDSPHQVTVDQVVRALGDWQARASS